MPRQACGKSNHVNPKSQGLQKMPAIFSDRYAKSDFFEPFVTLTYGHDTDMSRSRIRVFVKVSFSNSFKKSVTETVLETGFSTHGSQADSSQ